MSCLTHAQEVAKIRALHGLQSEAERVERVKFMVAHNAKAEELWTAYKPNPWRMPDPKDKPPTDTGSLRDMIEHQYQRRAR
jgi:hypothetical protein